MKTDPNIKLDRNSDKTSALLCPRCGGNYLRHQGVTFFDRSEDEKIETKIEVGGTTISMSRVPENTGNPSSRRDGMVISFDCEGCGGGKAPNRIELTIGQHKGTTEIGWRFDPPKAG